MTLSSAHQRGKQRVLETWTVRVGESAAQDYWLLIKRVILVPLVGPTWLALLIIGARSRSTPVVGVAVFLVVAHIALVLQSWLLFRRFRTKASGALGVSVRWNEPPADKGKYVEWCRRKGIEPFRPVSPPRP